MNANAPVRHTKMKLIPITREVLDAIPARVPVPEQVKDAMTKYPGFAGVDGDKVFAAAGFGPVWPGYAQAWFILSREATPVHLLFCVREVRKWLATCPFHRVDTTVQADMGRTVQWLETMGFEIEGLLHKYDSNGEDYILMAFTKENGA